MDKAIFLDRDGTINVDVGFCSSPARFNLLPQAAKGIKELNVMGFKVVLITNQSGIARGYFSYDTLNAIHEKMKNELSKDGAHIDAIYVCPHLPDDGCNCHKPKPGLAIQAAVEHDIDPLRSYVIGDTGSDVGVARHLGCLAINIGGERVFKGPEQKADFSVPDLLSACRIVKRKTVVMVTGAKGCGKSTVRQFFERSGFIGVDTESAYLKHGELYPGEYIQNKPEVIDALYLETMGQVLKRCGEGNVVFESTGTNKRWGPLKEKFSRYHDVVVVKVTCPLRVAEERMAIRNPEGHYAASGEETLSIAGKSSGISYDYLIDNSGPVADIQKKVTTVLGALDGKTPELSRSC